MSNALRLARGWPVGRWTTPGRRRYIVTGSRSLACPGSYERFAVRPGQFRPFAAQIGQDELVGANVTAPHKEAAFAFATN